MYIGCSVSSLATDGFLVNEIRDFWQNFWRNLHFWPTKNGIFDAKSFGAQSYNRIVGLSRYYVLDFWKIKDVTTSLNIAIVVATPLGKEFIFINSFCAPCRDNWVSTWPVTPSSFAGHLALDKQLLYRFVLRCSRICERFFVKYAKDINRSATGSCCISRSLWNGLVYDKFWLKTAVPRSSSTLCFLQTQLSSS